MDSSWLEEVASSLDTTEEISEEVVFGLAVTSCEVGADCEELLKKSLISVQPEQANIRHKINAIDKYFFTFSPFKHTKKHYTKTFLQ